jgi:hypothetical protein
VLKTVAITLVAVIGAGLILFGSLALFAPKSVADFFDGMGMYKPAVNYYEKQYGKSDNIDDLAVLILKIDAKEDSEKAERYLKILLDRKDYVNYCYMNDQLNQDRQVSFDEHYKGQYALALVRNNKFNEGLAVANSYVLANGYTAFNPYSVIIVELGSVLNVDQLNEIKTQISTYLGGEQDALIQTDVDAIEQLIG